MSSTVVPVGSLAIIFAGIIFLVILKKAIVARQSDQVIKNRMAEKLALRNRPLAEQKHRLEELLKK